MAEKSYLIYITVLCIIAPALCLSSVSYDWSFHETGFVPSGYYIQLYIILYMLELTDCLAVADGLFLCSSVLLICNLIIGKNKKFRKLYEIVAPEFIIKRN